MTYRPRVSYSTTEVNTGKTVDGAAVYAAAYSISGNLSTGNSRSASITTAITRAIGLKGGFTRSDGDLYPFPGHGTVNGATWAVIVVLDFVSSLYRFRVNVGSAFTGTGNVLSDSVVIGYYLK